MADQSTDTNAPPAVSRACRVCHAPLEQSQEWCLACGAAVASPNRRLPGKRAAATVATLTLVLTGGAVAAAYAALSSPPGAPKQLAQALPPGANPDTTPLPPPTTTPTTPIPTPTVPTATLPKLPKITGPSPVPQIPSSTPSLPSPSPAPTTTTKPIPTTPPTTTTTTTPTQPQSVTLALKADDVGPYDPDSRIVSPLSNRGKLFDKDDTTAWTASAAAGETELRFGITVDLVQREELEKLILSGKTGGIEIYGTTADELPPAIDDPAWKKIGVVESLDGEKRIAFPEAKVAKKYDLLLLWFTTAPPSGPTVSLSSLSVTVRR